MPSTDTANVVVEPSRSPWEWGHLQQQPVRSNGGPTMDESIPEGAYVTDVGGANVLFRVQNGRLQFVEPTEIVTLGITQNDIKEINPLLLHSLPREAKGRGPRAIGRDLQTYLWSDLKAGHYMQSWVWLQGTTLTVRTLTETVTWFGGYTGGVSVNLYDAGGNLLNQNPFRYRYGVDGRAFGSGRQDRTETAQVPQDMANAAENILIAHYWDPKVDLIQVAIVIGRLLWEAIQIILESQARGEAVNAGGTPF
jgi:hypothetical protein